MNNEEIQDFLDQHGDRMIHSIQHNDHSVYIILEQKEGETMYPGLKISDKTDGVGVEETEFQKKPPKFQQV